MKKKKSIIGVILFIMSIILMDSCIFPSYLSNLESVRIHYDGSKDENRVIIPDICFSDNEWIYYSSPYNGCIYKVKSDGSKKTLITKDSAQFGCILLYDDNVYYINSKDNCLYKIKTSGYSKKKISDVKVETAYDGYFLYNNFVYYYNDSFELKKIDSKGKTFNADSEKTIVGFTGYNTKIYKGYTYNWKDDGLYRTNLQNLKEEKIYNGNVYPQFEIYNDNIYMSTDKCKNIYKLNCNGGETEKILDGNIAAFGPDYDLGRFKVIDDNIYYIDYTHNGYGILYKVNIDGTNKRVIAENATDFMINGYDIYYFDSVDNGILYQIKSDGSDRKTITKGNFTYFINCPDNITVFGEKSENPQELMYGKLFVIKPNYTGFFELN